MDDGCERGGGDGDKGRRIGSPLDIYNEDAYSGKVMKIKSEEKHPNGKMYENKFGYNTISEVYVNKSLDIMELSAIRKPAFGKGDRKSMTLLPSFNRKEREIGGEIPTSRDYRIMGVKRLATLDPNFFFFERVQDIAINIDPYPDINMCLSTYTHMGVEKYD